MRIVIVAIDIRMQAMTNDPKPDSPDGTALLEHMTGPSRGRTVWLGQTALDVRLTPGRLLRIEPSRAGEPDDETIARLHRSEDTYEIEAIGDRPVWVNKTRITHRRLRDRDIVEFGEAGPLSRFHLLAAQAPARRRVDEIFGDAISYLRTSRRPVQVRILQALYDVARRLVGQTTILFRLTVILAIVALATVAWQQHRLNEALQQQLASSEQRASDFARILARTRAEALSPADLQSLRDEFGGRIESAGERLARLEQRSSAGARVVAEAMPSVLFLQGAYGFREISSGRMMRQVVDAAGKPLITPFGEPLLSIDGDGPVAERQFTGTGFVLRRFGIVVTNRHVALPWETDAAGIEAFSAMGFEPVMIRFIAYPPTRPDSLDVTVLKTRSDTDLAILEIAGLPDGDAGLDLADTPPRAGEPVIVMGYPTGLRSLLAQSGDAFVESLQQMKDTNFWSVAARLAENGFIAPLASRGIVGQVTESTIVYDAETTHGGSGGPVLDMDGRVVAVNAAILPEFGGSNLGIPAPRLRTLLAEMLAEPKG